MKLSVLKNSQLLSEIDLGKEVHGVNSALTFFIGRADTCHVELPDPQISREHAEIIYQAGQWFVHSLSPLAPVVLNARPVTQAPLANGDVLNIGQYRINISMPAPEKSILREVTAVEEVTHTLPSSEDDNAQEDIATTVMPMERELSPEETLQEEAEEGDGDKSTSFSPINEAEDNDPFVSEEFTPSDEDDDVELQAGDGFEVDAYDDDAGDKTIVFNSFARFELELFGEFAPYDRFILEKPEVLIGRDASKCQIVLSDPEVSSVHAAILRQSMRCTLVDKNSANGTIHNGSRINSIELVNGDEFIIGSTTFTVKVISDLLEKEADRLMPVEENQVVEVEEIQEVSADFGEASEDLDGAEEEEAPKSLVGKLMRAWKNPAQRKRLLVIAVIIAAGLVLLESESPSTAPKAKDKDSRLDASGKAVTSKSATSKVLTPEQLEFISSRYELAKEFFESGKYAEAVMELEAVSTVDPDFKQTQQLMANAKSGMAQLEEIEKKRQKELEEKERQQKLKVLLEKATTVVDEHREEEAKEFFNQIIALDPENFEVQQLKARLEAWVREQERIAVEKAAKEEERKRRVGLLAPGKNEYLKKEWFAAIGKLEEFLRIPSMDEDLIEEASKMLTESKDNLNAMVGPLVGKARSLREGQDLKGAYEHYLRALQYDPINAEALSEMNEIRENLTLRARKVYREAIIAESLSLFRNAKEKLQEVQQIAPTDSEYYQKATAKLKEYME